MGEAHALKKLELAKWLEGAHKLVREQDWEVEKTMAYMSEEVLDQSSFKESTGASRNQRERETLKWATTANTERLKVQRELGKCDDIVEKELVAIQLQTITEKHSIHKIDRIIFEILEK